jgi:hypothetical protein
VSAKIRAVKQPSAVSRQPSAQNPAPRSSDG